MENRREGDDHRAGYLTISGNAEEIVECIYNIPEAFYGKIMRA